MKMSPDQCRAARALLGLDEAAFAQKAGVSIGAIAAFESGADLSDTGDPDAMQQTLEAAGVEFLANDDAGMGVRQKLSASADDDGLTPEELNAANDE